MRKIAYFVSSLNNIKDLSTSGDVYLFIVGKVGGVFNEVGQYQVRFVSQDNITRMLIPSFFDEIYVETDIDTDMSSYVKNKYNLYKLGA